LNPTITVILIAKFNPTLTAYLIPYISEGYDNKKFCYRVSLLLKVEHISYTMGIHDIYTLAFGPADKCVYIRQSTHAHGMTITHTYIYTHQR